MKLSRLPGRKNVAYLLRKGEVWKGRTMVIRYLRRAPRHPAIDPTAHAVYVGALTSAKLDKSAVKRNRMRRRCREALRIALKEHHNFPTAQLLVAPKKASLNCDYHDIKRDVASFLSLF